MAKLGLEFATLFESCDQGFDFGPKRFWMGMPALSTQTICSTISLSMIAYIHQLFPNLKVGCLFTKQWILLKEWYDYMIKIGCPTNPINYLGLTWRTSRFVKKIAYAQGVVDHFQEGFIICPQFDFETHLKLRVATLVDDDNRLEMPFPIRETSHPMTKLIGYFQVKAQSLLHHSLLSIKPTNPPLDLLCQRAADERISGLDKQNRPLSDYPHHTIKSKRCQDA